jgi:hypothetical protein
MEVLVMDVEQELNYLETIQRLKGQLEAEQAGAASLREALEYYANEDRWEHATYSCACAGIVTGVERVALADPKIAQQTLQSPAGAAMLEQLRRAEKVCEVARTVLGAMEDYDAGCLYTPKEELKKALAMLDKEANKSK